MTTTMTMNQQNNETNYDYAQRLATMLDPDKVLTTKQRETLVQDLVNKMVAYRMFSMIEAGQYKVEKVRSSYVLRLQETLTSS